MMTTHGLRIEPLDVLFFRDGRPFDAASRGVSGLGSPQTLAGALRTALLARTGFDFRAFAQNRKSKPIAEALQECKAHASVVVARFRGPWPACFPTERTAMPFFPLPLDLAKKKDDDAWLQLRPRSIPGWSDPALLPLIPDERTDSKAGARWISLDTLKKYLIGTIPTESELLHTGQIFAFDERTGIEINADTLTSAQGKIYGIRLLALQPKVNGSPAGLFAEIESSFDKSDLEKLLHDPIPLGGEGRYVCVRVIEKAEWPTQPARQKRKWVLVSPAFLPNADGRPLPAEAGLKAAISGAGIAVSGWDVARNGPRATRFAVPAGAVYYFENGGPNNNMLGGSAEDQQEGWGFSLPGTWEE